MQKAASYLLERSWAAEGPDERRRDHHVALDTVERWLFDKGGHGGDSHGTFEAQDGATATWSREAASDGESTWRLLALKEVHASGRRVDTLVSVTGTAERLAAYITLEVGVDSPGVREADADVRCPRIVRDLANLWDWHRGPTRIQGLSLRRGFDAGHALAEVLLDPQRALPVVVVSEHWQEPARPALDERLSHELFALALVVRVDRDASWGLTDALGPSFGCYDGAVRLFWPGFDLGASRFSHPLWVRDRIVGPGEPAAEVNRFLGSLRSILMRASALSVARPHEIDRIRDAEARAKISARTPGDAESAEWVAIVEAENAYLVKAKGEALTQAMQLSARLAAAERDLGSARQELDAAKVRLRELGDPLGGPAEDEGQDGPVDDEVRYYKKHFDTPKYDVMKPVADCGHNAWQSAHKAEKAKKGIARLEGRGNWRTLQHCSKCDGGGMWRVRW